MRFPGRRNVILLHLDEPEHTEAIEEARARAITRLKPDAILF